MPRYKQENACKGATIKRCLNCKLAGIPAVIYHRDGLTLATWDKWETPAYIMQYSRFKAVKR